MLPEGKVFAQQLLTDLPLAPEVENTTGNDRIHPKQTFLAHGQKTNFSTQKAENAPFAITNARRRSSHFDVIALHFVLVSCKQTINLRSDSFCSVTRSTDKTRTKRSSSSRKSQHRKGNQSNTVSLRLSSTLFVCCYTVDTLS
jgi:hypothetical protein